MGSKGCRRPLNSSVLAEEFAQNILNIRGQRMYSKAGEKIAKAEMTLRDLESNPTKTHTDYRNSRYRTDEQRSMLRDRILAELISEPRLENDDKIKLGRGGAKPADTKSDSQAYIVSGAPASGKSGIAARLARENGAYILDSDYAKRKFPEYSKFPGGASLVHEESDGIIFSPENSLLEFCIYSRHNVVIPLVGKSYGSVETICMRLIKAGYKVHVVNVALDRYKCALRAYQRFCETNRYVPLSYVFDEVGNEPERVYYVMKRAHEGDTGFASFSQFSTDVERGRPPKLLDYTDQSPVRSWND